MSGWENAWIPLVLLLGVLFRFSFPVLGTLVIEADLGGRKESAAKDAPLLIETAIVQERREEITILFHARQYYIDFWLPGQNTIIPFEVSYRLYNALQDGQSGILTYQGGAFRSFLRNGETIYDKC